MPGIPNCPVIAAVCTEVAFIFRLILVTDRTNDTIGSQTYQGPICDVAAFSISSLPGHADHDGLLQNFYIPFVSVSHSVVSRAGS